MTLSTKFVTSTPLSAGSFFPNPQDWDVVLPYSKYFIQLQTDKKCEINVFQSNENTPSTSLSVEKTIQYENLGQVVIFEGDILCDQISFVLTNTSSENETTLFYSIMYK